MEKKGKHRPVPVSFLEVDMQILTSFGISELSARSIPVQNAEKAALSSISIF